VNGAAPAGARRVSVLDLSLDQLEAIERAIGLPVNRWPAAPSAAQLYRLIYAASTDVDPDTLGAMTLRQLQAAVDLAGDSEPDQ